jgi:peptidoglycan hydrolase CwlO-like protein
MNKKFKIIIVIILIAVIGVAGYFAYTSYASAEFDKNLKEAYDYGGMRVNKHKNLFSKLQNEEELNENIKNGDKIISSLDKEINSLEKTKSFTQTPAETKYIELQIKLKNNYKKDFKLNKEYLEYIRKYFNGQISINDITNKFKEITKEVEEHNDESEKIIDEIRELLIKNPQLKNKLESFNFEDSYIGES